MKTIIQRMALLAALWGGGAAAVEVHVTEQQNVGGVVTELRTVKAETGTNFVTQVAPRIDGQIFVGWTLANVQDFSPRDTDGRTYDAQPVMIYEKTTLTANYLAESVDEDADGVADGHELYWYGDLSHDGAYDGDGDGRTFAEELAAGTNPLFADVHLAGVLTSEGDLLLYNPEGLAAYVMRSEPEGVLFETVIDYVKPGTAVNVPFYSPSTSTFGYWTTNGVVVADADGRALNTFSFPMPKDSVEIVAHVVENEMDRQKLYWYGTTEIADDSDTDGDGLTFAEELAAGTNPLFADASLHGVVTSAGDLLQYNPENIHKYTLRSVPEGELFETVSDYAAPGKKITAPSVNVGASNFAYWETAGERVADEDGRAVAALVFTMPSEDVDYAAVCVSNEADRAKLAWYGTTDIADDSDTDGDGATFAAEMAAGTNPLFANESTHGVVTSTGGDVHEMNLQVYDQANGLVVGGRFDELTFATGITPVVADLNGDGLFDFVVLGDDGSRRVYLNVGAKGSLEFNETPWQDGWTALVDAARLTDVSGLALDTSVEDPLSYTLLDDDGDGVLDLLASDVQGRIWCYKGIGQTIEQSEQSNNSYALQHKVWGGSHPGFANGLKIAAVDWEDDGNGDLLCGTAEGRLFLIRDPRGGRPANLKLSAGADSVSLAWDPTPQSKVRGYRVYRNGETGETNLVATTELPKYLDKPEDTSAYEYRVASYSRFYRTGNSKPIQVESVATDPVRAQTGRVKFTWRPASGAAGDDVKVDFAIENAFHVAADQLSLRVGYDEKVLTPLRVERTGLTSDLRFVETKGNGVWIVSGTGGSIAPGAGTFLSFVFAVADRAGVAETQVTVEEFTLKSVGHENIVPVVESGKVEIGEETPPDATYVAVGSKGDLNCDGRLSWEDVELYLQWKDRAAGEVPEAICRAGDFNGDGVMDNRDYGLLKAFYSQKAKECPGLKGWDKNHGYKEVGK